MSLLAIGIGVNVAAFGFFDLAVLRPLAVREPGTILRFHRRAPESYAYTLPYPEMAFIREYSKTLSAVLALNPARLTIEGEDKPVNAHFVTANFFSELGVAARLGRMLDPVRDAAGDAEPVVVLSQGFWLRHFGGDPLVVGRTIHLNSKPAVVIGVARNEFTGLSLDKPELGAPIMEQPYFVDGSQLLSDFSIDASGVKVWGRLQPGLTPKEAEDELRSLGQSCEGSIPTRSGKTRALPVSPVATPRA
jgi:hypothetical protein